MKIHITDRRHRSRKYELNKAAKEYKPQKQLNLEFMRAPTIQNQ